MKMNLVCMEMKSEKKIIFIMKSFVPAHKWSVDDTFFIIVVVIDPSVVPDLSDSSWFDDGWT